MKAAEQKAAAKHFASVWKGKGYEKGDSQKFWLSLLSEVLGVEHAAEYISFEDQVHLDHTSFIDGYIETTHVLIEQKSIEKDLNAPIKQSDGTFLTPFQQAKRYITELPLSKHPRWVVTCNFRQFNIYDMENPQGEAEILLLEDLPEEYYRLNFLVNKNDANIKRQETVSLKAGELVGKIYDALAKKYDDPNDEETKKSLNKLCVRIVFCLYAEDAGLFSTPTSFHDYLATFNPENAGMGLQALFKVLNTEHRRTLPNPLLKDFPYVNGGLFADDDVEMPWFDEEIVKIILEDCSANFNWSQISPTIFGSIFESTLNPQTRRSGGMHYTSIENIHKVIDPLFLDELKNELEEIKAIKTLKNKKEKLLEYQNKLAGLKFLDPACGSGNFLTESYICLRKLENETISEYYSSDTGQKMLITDDIIKVKISQFYGIEINDFAVAVAKTALWIAESQMLAETESLSPGSQLSFLPLSKYENIVEANALRKDWNEVVPKEQLNYIMGNPPFYGAMKMNEEQKKEITDLCKDFKCAGELDYVSGWYKKAIDYMKDTTIQAAFVSTNSICQGQQASTLWQPLFEAGIQINFAHRTFIWDSEANVKAHVHCVIIGFSFVNRPDSRKYLFEDGICHIVPTINSYLVNAPVVFVESRTNPICEVPSMHFGNMPRDGGGFILTLEDKNELLRENRENEQWIKLYLGAEEFINKKDRWCLWLEDAKPEDIIKSKLMLERVNSVKKMREASKAASTRKLAATPTRFAQITQPKGKDFILVPRVSSENRQYIPMGFMDKNVIASDAAQIVSGAKLYHFAVLTSSAHMAWMRAVCGRLEMRYRYSKDIVYNNFPWPTLSDSQKDELNRTAQKILDARAENPNCSLADMYGDKMYLFANLDNAHKENDKAVLKAYGLKPDTSEEEIVAFLMKKYQELTK